MELLFAGKQARRPAQGVLQPPQAEVVAAALDQHGGELQRHHAGQERDVLPHQLLLEADGVGGDDHPPPGLPSPRRGRIEDRRHQVGETLAHARARLDDQVLLRADRLGHRFGHRQLLGPMLVAFHAGGDPPLRAQDFAGREHRRDYTVGWDKLA